MPSTDECNLSSSMSSSRSSSSSRGSGRSGGSSSSGVRYSTSVDTLATDWEPLEFLEELGKEPLTKQTLTPNP